MNEGIQFKRYDQKQEMLIPKKIGDFIPDNHPVRIINDIVDAMDISPIIETYSPEGRPSYHPRMMIKILLFSYTRGIRSSRKIQRNLRENLAYKYLAADQDVDFRTICDFRTHRLEDIEDIFVQIVTLCKEIGLVKVGNISLDGMKIQANAAVEKSRDIDTLTKEEHRLRKQIQHMLQEAEDIDRKEDHRYGEGTNPYILPEELKDKEKRLEKIRDAKRKLERSDNDTGTVNLTDDTAQLMKFRDSSKKPAYNGQAAVDEEQQVIVAADLTTDANDQCQLQPMAEQVKDNLDGDPGSMSMDSGYFSYHNLEYLERQSYPVYMPDQFFEIEKRGGCTRFRKSRFTYDPEEDQYICPGDNSLRYHHTQKRDGEPDLRIYRASPEDCSRCPYKEHCTTSTARYVSRDPRERLMEKMRERLNDDEGQQMYKKRRETVEPTFGDIKYNKAFSQFLLRGLDKCKTEFILACMAHNLDKIVNNLQGPSNT